MVGNVNMPSIGSGTESYIENGVEMVGSTGSNQCHSLGREDFQVTGRELDEDSDCDSSPRSTSEGTSEKMEWFRDGDKRGLSIEGVVGQVLENVRAAGYGEAVCTEFRQHFSRLPSR